MKKSFKKFLVLSQVLGWSALVASACTEEQVKTAAQTITDNNSKNSAATQSHQTKSSTNKNESTNDSITGDNNHDNAKLSVDKSKGEKGSTGDTSSPKTKTKEAQGIPQEHRDEHAKQGNQTSSPEVSNEHDTVKGDQARTEEGAAASGEENASKAKTQTGEATMHNDGENSVHAGGDKGKPKVSEEPSSQVPGTTKEKHHEEEPSASTVHK